MRLSLLASIVVALGLAGVAFADASPAPAARRSGIRRSYSYESSRPISPNYPINGRPAYLMPRAIRQQHGLPF